MCIDQFLGISENIYLLGNCELGCTRIVGDRRDVDIME